MKIDELNTNELLNLKKQIEKIINDREKSSVKESIEKIILKYYRGKFTVNVYQYKKSVYVCFFLTFGNLKPIDIVFNLTGYFVRLDVGPLGTFDHCCSKLYPREDYFDYFPEKLNPLFLSNIIESLFFVKIETYKEPSKRFIEKFKEIGKILKKHFENIYITGNEGDTKFKIGHAILDIEKELFDNEDFAEGSDIEEIFYILKNDSNYQ